MSLNFGYSLFDRSPPKGVSLLTKKPVDEPQKWGTMLQKQGGLYVFFIKDCIIWLWKSNKKYLWNLQIILHKIFDCTGKAEVKH